MLLISKVTFLNWCYLLQTQLSSASKGTYRDYLGKLDLQYGKLLVIFQKSISSDIFIST